MKQKVFFLFGLGKIGMDLFNKLKVFAPQENWKVYGFEVDKNKINNKDIFHISQFTQVYSKENSLKFFIISVPTNIDEETKKPDTTPFDILKIYLKRIEHSENEILINQSTVYPGFTMEFAIDCGFKQNIFMIPERFDESNPQLGIDRVIGATQTTIPIINEVKTIYEKIGFKIHKVINTETAEASKLLENIQRDVNIALMNEFKNCINEMNKDLLLQINMNEVLECAYTKKNFARFKPGLVGGHCIPYDPYWFIYKARNLGANPKLITISREINEDEIEKTYFKIVEEILKENHYEIMIHGITYKKGSRDYKYSPAFKILKKIHNLNLPYDRNIYIWDKDLFADEVDEIIEKEFPFYLNYYCIKDDSKITKQFYLKEL